jgi:hypothetical protein
MLADQREPWFWYTFAHPGGSDSMNVILQFAVFQWCCITAVAAFSPGLFRWASALAIAFGVAIGLSCAHVSWLFHIHYRLRFAHYILCLLAATVTAYCTLAIISFTSSKRYALAAVDAARTVANFDRHWSNRAYKEAFFKVKNLNLENFDGVQEPGRPESWIPMKNPESRAVVGAIYAAAATQHFRWLNIFMQRDNAAFADRIRRDVDIINDAPTAYHPSRLIEISTENVVSQIKARLERFVWLNVAIDLVFFTVVQFISFGVISRAAYKAIKVTT